MAGGLRSPVVLMAVYVAVFVWGGPWLGSGSSAHRNVPQIAIVVVLAVLVALGSRSARVLMICYSLASAFAVFYGSTRWGASEPYAATLLALTSIFVQIGLLVSTPVYRRTRPGWAQAEGRAEPLLPRPKLWVALAGTAGGLVMALVPFSDGIRQTACSVGGIRFAQSCGAEGFGYPIAYRFASYSLGPRGVDVAAFATDLALLGLSVFLVLYLVQLRKSREHPDPGEQPTVEPIPAAP